PTPPSWTAVGAEQGVGRVKMQNVSAVFQRYGLPLVTGYLPAGNAQTALEEVVLRIAAARSGAGAQMARRVLESVAQAAATDAAETAYVARRGQGFSAKPEVRKAIEEHAVGRATA